MSSTISPAARPHIAVSVVAPKDTGASTTQSGADTSPACDWLMAWVAQNTAPADAPVQVPANVGTGQVEATKIHWLTLLAGANPFTADSAVDSAIRDGSTKTEGDDGSLQSVDPGDAAGTPEGIPAAIEEMDGDEELGPGTQDEAAVGVPVSLDPVRTVPGMPAAANAPVASVATSSDAGIDSRRALPELAPRSQSVLNTPLADPPAHPAVTPKDKGELIWMADFTVQETPDQSTSDITRVLPRDRAAFSLESANAVKPSAAKFPDSVPQGSSAGGSAQQEFANQDTESDTKESDTKSAQSEISRRRTAPSAQGEARIEPQSAVPDHAEGRALESVARGSGAVSEFAPREGSTPEHGALASAERISTERATALRPTQVATVQVDVPGPAGSEDLTPLRLIVSQRGDQVSVRLRSWDVGPSAIEDGRMQPLLHSLAEKGLVQELKPAGRAEELIPFTAERSQEKQILLAESARNSSDSQAFREGSDRQQQNEQRQQQQQAFFLRKQMKMTHSGEFEIPSPADTGGGQNLQGAL